MLSDDLAEETKLQARGLYLRLDVKWGEWVEGMAGVMCYTEKAYNIVSFIAIL